MIHKKVPTVPENYENPSYFGEYSCRYLSIKHGIDAQPFPEISLGLQSFYSTSKCIVKEFKTNSWVPEALSTFQRYVQPKKEESENNSNSKKIVKIYTEVWRHSLFLYLIYFIKFFSSFIKKR